MGREHGSTPTCGSTGYFLDGGEAKQKRFFFSEIKKIKRFDLGSTCIFFSVFQCYFYLYVLDSTMISLATKAVADFLRRLGLTPETWVCPESCRHGKRGRCKYLSTVTTIATCLRVREQVTLAFSFIRLPPSFDSSAPLLSGHSKLGSRIGDDRTGRWSRRPRHAEEGRGGGVAEPRGRGAVLEPQGCHDRGPLQGQGLCESHTLI